MTDGATIDIDMTGLNRAIASLHEVLPGDSADLLRDETRRLGRQIMNFTPPFRSGGGAGAARKVGEEAVRRNLISMFSEVEPGLIDKIGSEHGTTNVDTWIKGKSDQPIRLRWDSLDPTGERTFERHQKARNHVGRVTKGRKRVQGIWSVRAVVPKGTLPKYIKRTQARVGRHKATFALVVAKLGGKVPSWLSRHFAKLGSLAVANIEGLKDGNNPTVTFGSRAPGNARIAQRARDAVRARTKAIERRIRLIVSGYNKDIANGYKARRKVKTGSSAIESAHEDFLNG